MSMAPSFTGARSRNGPHPQPAEKDAFPETGPQLGIPLAFTHPPGSGATAMHPDWRQVMRLITASLLSRAAWRGYALRRRQNHRHHQQQLHLPARRLSRVAIPSEARASVGDGRGALHSTRAVVVVVVDVVAHQPEPHPIFPGYRARAAARWQDRNSRKARGRRPRRVGPVSLWGAGGSSRSCQQGKAPRMDTAPSGLAGATACSVCRRWISFCNQDAAGSPWPCRS